MRALLDGNLLIALLDADYLLHTQATQWRRKAQSLLAQSVDDCEPARPHAARRSCAGCASSANRT